MTPQEQAIDLLSKMCVNNCTKKNINRMISASITAIDLLIENSESLNIRYWMTVKKRIVKVL